MEKKQEGAVGGLCRYQFVLFSFLLTVNLGSEPLSDDYLWDHPNEVEISAGNVAFTHQKYSHAKTDSVFIMGYFNDGWVFMFSLFHLDARLVDRWGMYALVTDPEGNSYWKTKIPDARDITISEDHLYYNDGVTVVEYREEVLTMKADFGGFVCDLTFTDYIRPWKPGTGRVDYTDDGENFQYKTIFVPWASVEGTIEVDGLKVDVHGQGYGEKTIYVNPLTRQQPYLDALRVYTPHDTPREESWHIGLHQVTLHKAYGYKKITRLVLARDDEWLFTTRDYTFEPLDYRTPDFSPYEYPTRFRLRAEKHGYIIDGVVTEKVFFHFTDVFDSLPRWIRSVLLVFFKRPVYYRYIADFTGSITEPDGTIHEMRLSGPYEYVVVF